MRECNEIIFLQMDRQIKSCRRALVQIKNMMSRRLRQMADTELGDKRILTTGIGVCSNTLRLIGREWAVLTDFEPVSAQDADFAQF